MITKCAVMGYSFYDNDEDKNYAGCHEPGTGQFDLVTHSDLTNEIEDDGLSSDFITKLHTSVDEHSKEKMPPVGVISSGEIQDLKDWVSDGLPNNACNPCGDYTAGSFVSVSKILYDNCSGCHNERSKQSGFIFFKEHPSGPADIDTATVRAQSSAILATIVGNGVSRMPKNIDPLFECEYKVIQKWVDDGMPMN